MTTEKPTGDSTHDQQPLRRSWWRKKRVWIPALVLILLVIIGAVVGAVFGVRNSRSEDASSERERLFAAQGGASSLQSGQATQYTTAASASDTRTLVTTPTSASPTSSSLSSSSSDSEPSSSPLPLLQAFGFVPNDLSAAVGGPSPIFWDLRAEGQLFRKEGGSSWEAYEDRQFLVAPIAVRTGEDTQTAISIDAVNGRMLYSHFRDGQWGDWEELDFAAQFRARPAVISRAQGKVDVFIIDSNAYLLLVSYDGSTWSEWTELADATNGNVAATSWGENRIDVFVKYGDTTNAPVQHKHWTAESGWAEKWEDLGNPFSSGWDSSPRQTGIERYSSPLATSWCDAAGECKVDVILNAGSTSHRLFHQGAWTDWDSLGASHEGVEFPDTASIVRGDGLDGRPFAHLVSRGTDTCIHHIALDGTSWASWTYLWCEFQDGGSNYPSEYLPTFLASVDGANIQVFARDLDGDLHKYGFHGAPAEWPPYPQGNEKWENLGRP